MTIKRILAILLTLCLILGTVGCSSKGDNTLNTVISKRKYVKISGSPNLDYSGQKVGILVPPEKPEYYDDVVKAIKSGVNATVEEISWENAATQIDAQKYEVIILPEAKSYPANASTAIDNYMQNGGKLLTLGGPPLQDGKELVNGKWLNQQEAFDTAEKKKAVDFSKTTEASFTLNADNPGQLGYELELEKGAPDGGTALHVKYPNPKNWAQISVSATGKLAGANSITFYVKGCYYLMQHGLCIGVNDGTGTYYAVIKPSSDWSLYTLTEEDFYLWADNRIQEDKHPNLDNVKHMSFGIAQTHTPFHVGKLYEYWITSPSLQKVGDLGAIDMVLEGIAPEYKFFPITNGDSAEASQNQSFVATRKYTLPDELFSATHRPQGIGYSRDRDQRFVPLIEVRDEKDLRSGYLAWMYVFSTGIRETETPYEGSIVAGFGTSDAKFYNKNGCAAVVDVLRALLNDYMFIEAGASEDIYVDAETKVLSMGAYTRGKAADGITLNFDFIKDNKTIFTKEYDLSKHRVAKTTGDTEVKAMSFEYEKSEGKPDYVVATIQKDGKVLDTITQDITFWSPKPEKERKYVTTANNEFIRDGKVIRFYGVSYLPTSGIASEDQNFWEYYLSRESFDPDVVYNDLLRLKEVGFNSIGTFIYYRDAIETKSLLWLAYVCDMLDMYLEVDIRPHADPFNLKEEEVVATFENLHLAELDNIVSFGVAWERSFGSYDGNYGNDAGRKAYDEYWTEWVENNYGSIANAEFEWGESMPRNAQGQYTAVSDEALREKVPTKLVAAYRRFADDLVASKHAYVRELFDRLAPNHMITARAGDVGCIPLQDAAKMGYEFTALAAGMDYLSPEYYSSTDLADQMIFTNVYSRYSSPDAPVVWKEFQVTNRWGGSNFNDPAYETLRKDIVEESIKNIKAELDNIIAGGTSGCYYWYSAGGYRYNEKSDCGVINPDGSDRAVTKLIREYKDKFMNRPALRKTEAVIEINRDDYNNSIAGLYSDVQEDLLLLIKGGVGLAFKDKSTGTNTDTVSDAGVGGGFASSTNPARWVNGVFQAVYVKQADGSWQQIKSGDVVSAGKKLEIKVVMTNMMGSEWLSKAKSKQSYVSLVSTDKSDISFDIPLKKNVKHLETFTQEFELSKSVTSGTQVQFRLGIQDRFPFANPFTFTVL